MPINIISVKVFKKKDVTNIINSTSVKIMFILHYVLSRLK
jgi:hypothetical protein